MTESPTRNPLAPVAQAIERLMRGVDRGMELLVIGLFALIVVVGALQVFCRYVLNASLSWSEELQRYGLIWLVFLALVIGYRRGAHIGMDLLKHQLPLRLQTALAWVIDALWLALGLAMVIYTAFYSSAAGFTFLKSVSRQSSAGLGVRMDLVYACIVIGGVYLTLAAVTSMVVRLGGASSRPVERAC